MFVAATQHPQYSAAVAPVALSAAINAAGALLTIVFDKNVNHGSGGSGGVTLSFTGGAVAASYLSGGGSSTLTYSLSRSIFLLETGVASYTQPGNGIEDAATQVDVRSFAGLSVTNQSTQTNTQFRWNAPVAGPAPTGYQIEWGSSPGVYNQGHLADSGTALQEAYASLGLALNTTYYVIVRSVNGVTTSLPSNEIQVRNGQQIGP